MTFEQRIALLKPLSTTEIEVVIGECRQTNDFALSGIAVSPDERWMLYTQADQVSSELMLVDDFR